MSTNFRFPNITGVSEKEQLSQIKSYLHQLVEQLNYVQTTSIGSASTQTSQVHGQEVSYYELRSLIIQELQQVRDLFDELSAKMESEYVSDEELPQAIETALTEAKESGEFDGPQGPAGPQGPQGESGVSPTVTVTEIIGGHRVVITDATGEHTFDVMDGTGGGGTSSGLHFVADDGTIFY